MDILLSCYKQITTYLHKLTEYKLSVNMGFLYRFYLTIMPNSDSIRIESHCVFHCQKSCKIV